MLEKLESHALQHGSRINRWAVAWYGLLWKTIDFFRNYCFVIPLKAPNYFVMPAKAGIQVFSKEFRKKSILQNHLSAGSQSGGTCDALLALKILSEGSIYGEIDLVEVQV